MPTVPQPRSSSGPRELGYYGYDTKPFKKYLSIQSSKGYLHRLMLPEELKDMPFDKTLSKKITKFLKENDPKMIFIYGQNDPWTAAGVTWLKGKKNIHVFVEPRRKPSGTHRHTARRSKARSHFTDKQVAARIKRTDGPLD